MENSGNKNLGVVLVVDDVATNRMLLRSILTSQGYEVVECQGGRECLAYCEHVIPTMVLLDIMMPEMDGIETCRRLRNRYTKDELPIVIVTTKSEGVDIAEGLISGANDYVTKPVDRRVLLARIENQLAVSRFQRQVLEQKRESERNLAMQNAMGNALLDALAIQDRKGNIVYANLSLFEACNGNWPQHIKDAVGAIYDGSFKEQFEKKHGGLDLFFGGEFKEEYHLIGNVIRDIQVQSRIFTMEDAKEDLRLWVWRDLTAVRDLERKISQRVKLEMVGVFAAGVAHNFNNIFSSILGAAELLEKYCTENPKAVKCLDVVKRGIGAGSALTSKLAAFIRRDTSEYGGEMADLGGIIHQVIELHRKKEGTRVEFVEKVPEGLTPLQFDENNIRNVVENLVENAIEAITTTGKVEVCLYADRRPGFVEMEVVDNGVGIEAEIQERLFDPFFSTKNMDQVNKVSIAGRGLGLWNTYNLLMLIGGDISFKSSLGKGTKVVVSFPL